MKYLFKPILNTFDWLLIFLGFVLYTVVGWWYLPVLFTLGYISIHIQKKYWKDVEPRV